MLFSSIPFIYYFLPAFFLIYFLIPGKGKNCVILIGSLVFYASGEPRYLPLIITAVLVGYLGGILIAKTRAKRLWMVLSIIALGGMLAYCKYVDFFIDSVNAVTGLGIPLLRIALPMGISFYTFQILSYVVDVYRGDTEYQPNIITFGAYVTLFPQLIAGPIVRYSDVEKELQSRTHSIEKAFAGMSRFLVGLGKKLLLADQAAKLCDIFRASDEKSVLFYWMYALALAMYIYFDFSGYSDMAIGLGKIMGFEFPENFNYPYISKSATEFWRRWHMTLGGWFRDYLYIPMGGNRVSRPRWLLNILVVWMFTGLWHGAAWNFVVWGLIFAVLLVFEKLTGFYKKAPSWLSRIYLFLVVAFSFVVFNASDLAEAGNDILSMIGFGSLPLSSADTLYYLRSYAITLIIAVIGCTPLPKKLMDKAKERFPKVMAVVQPVMLIAVLLTATAYLVDGSFSPFLYFRF